MSLRRSARTPAKRALEDTQETPSASAPKKPRAEPKPRPNTTSLQYLLSNPRSKFAKVDAADIFNLKSWELLSEEARIKLLPLLPPTAFTNYVPEIDELHPSKRKSKQNDAMNVDQAGPSTPATQERSLDVLNPNFLKCHFLQSAAQQFQDQLTSGFFTEKSLKRVEMYNEAVANGTAHAPWKDDEWEAEHSLESEEEPEPVVSSNSKGKGKAKATPGRKPAWVPSFGDLVQNDSLRPCDLLVYKRSFMKPRLVVEKHLLVQSINPHTGAVTFLLRPGSAISFEDFVYNCVHDILQTFPTTNLTPSLSMINSPKKTRLRTTEDFDDFPSSHQTNSSGNPPEYLSITSSTTATAVESHILPLYADLPAEKIHQTDSSASKCFTVWRWKDEEAAIGGTADPPHGGRESIGTLHYLCQRCPRR